jgi:hypothetical protein
MQSVWTLQCFPLGHFGQLPPQSTSVSSPFLTPSLQVGAGGVQTPCTQVSPEAHTVPQAPQWSRSVEMLTHDVPQVVGPVPQTILQPAPEQT